MRLIGPSESSGGRIVVSTQLVWIALEILVIVGVGAPDTRLG